MPRFSFNVRFLCSVLLIGNLATWVSLAAAGPPDLTLAVPLHFLSPTGESVHVDAGTYAVGLEVEGQVRLEAEGQSPVLLAAQPTTHTETLVEATVLLACDEDHDDLIQIILLEPSGEAWEVTGSVSGVHTRDSTARRPLNAQQLGQLLQQPHGRLHQLMTVRPGLAAGSPAAGRPEQSIAEKYAALGGKTGVLGNLWTGKGETALSDGVGRFQQYQKGWILWHPYHGAHAIYGPVYLLNFTLLGIPSDPNRAVQAFGYPVQSARSSVPFKGWEVVVWERGATYAPRSLRGGGKQLAGDFYKKWQALHDAGTKLGLPESPEKGGGVQRFPGGKLLVRSGKGKVVLLDGQLFAYWKGQQAKLGEPLGDTTWRGAQTETQYENGTVQGESAPAPLKLFAQNMGLLVFPAGYNGYDRPGAIQRLIEYLRAEQFDVVGLSEVFADGERDQIANALRNLYPEGNRMDGPDKFGVESDGGLLLLSRHPIIAKNHDVFHNHSKKEITIYPPAGSGPGSGFPQVRKIQIPLCNGDDCMAFKGILHARIRVPGHPMDYNIFLTHLQNDNEGGPRASLPVTLLQTSVLREFVRKNTDSNNVAFMMGDFNLNAFDQSTHSDFVGWMGSWTCGRFVELAKAPVSPAMVAAISNRPNPADR